MDLLPAVTHHKLRLWVKLRRLNGMTGISASQLQEALDLALSESQETQDSLATFTLYTCIRFGEDAYTRALIVYLLETTNANLAAVSSYITCRTASIELFELLAQYGTDTIGTHEKNDRKRVLDLMVMNERLVQKMFELDASVEYDYQEPILEQCAQVGSVTAFKMLQEKGAKMTRRMLHKAAQEAASVGADPSAHYSDSTLSRHKKRIDVLKYLVEECKADINELDDNIGDPIGRFGYWGTPLNYAASEPRGAAMVRWLLKRGADPSIGKGDEHFDTWWVAKHQGCTKVLVELEGWNMKQQATEAIEQGTF